jgi:hypothetical protein
MKNFFILIGVISTVLILIVLVAGKTVEGDFKHESNIIFDVNQDLLWEIINNVEAYKKNKYGIVSIVENDYQGDTIISWRENYNLGISKDYDVIRRKDPEFLILRIKNNFTGMVSTLTFELSEDETKTYLKITEESVVDNILYRGLKVLPGKDAYINSQVKWIRVGLYNYLINK